MSHYPGIFKICRDCKQGKTSNEFYPKKNRDGLDTRCKACTIIIVQNRYKCAGCNINYKPGLVSNPDYDGKVYCYLCIAPTYVNLNMYNQYIDAYAKLKEYQNQQELLKQSIEYEQRRIESLALMAEQYKKVIPI